MSENDEICIASFPNRTEAQLALGALQANGIQGRVTADDAGGERPDLGSATGGVMLFVLEQDVEDARHVLDLDEQE